MSRQHSNSSHSAIDRAVALALLACAAGVGVGHAGNFTCTLVNSGNWTVAGNWSGCNAGADYPNNTGGNTFDAIIQSGAAQLRSGVTFGNATVGGTGDWQLYSGSASLTGALSVSGSGLVDLQNTATLHTAGAVTLASGGTSRLKIDAYGGGGGSQVSIGGNLTNLSSGQDFDGGVSIGNPGMTVADALSVAGTYTSTGGITDLTGGSVTGATARMTVGGAAPATLTGQYDLVGNAGGAELQWGSGGITQIGDGGANSGALLLHGANALVAIGASNSNNALTGLTTIASNGLLDLRDGSTVQVAGTLTVQGGNNGRLKVDGYGGCCSYGGSQMTIGGNLINQSTGQGNDGGVSLGVSQMTHGDLLSVAGTFTNTGGITNITGGSATGATARMTVGGAAPATLTGQYDLVGNAGGAELQWGSGGITQIGDGGANGGSLYINGANAYAEVSATNSNSALDGLTTLASNGQLDLRNGALVTTSGPLTVVGGGNAGGLKVDYNGGAGGSQVTIGGNLTNTSNGYFGNGGVDVGNGGMTSADLLSVAGTFTNTGGVTNLTGGSVAGATARMTIGGAAPATLTGSYGLVGNVGGAELQWGSGGITQIGDGGANSGNLYINGANAYAEVGATNSNSALTGLTSIASNGQLDLRDGAVVSTSGPLTVGGGGNGGGLKVDYYGGAGGSQVTIGGPLTNASSGYFGNGGVDVGNGGMTSADQLTVTGAFDNTASGTVIVQGNAAAGVIGTLQIEGAANTAGSVSIGNAGVVHVANGNAYTQSAGSTVVVGTLSAANVLNDGGSLQGTGSIVGNLTNAATLIGGVGAQPGTLTITGALTNTATGVVTTYAGASPAGNTLIAVGGPVQLQGGTLQANAINGLTFAPGKTYTVMTYQPGAMSGLFQAVQSGGATPSTHPTYLNLGNGTTLDVNYNEYSGNIQLATVATPSTTVENWTGGAGTWSGAAGWSSGAGPLSYSDVTLGGPTGSTVVLNQDGTINSLVVQQGNALNYQSSAPAALTVGTNVTVNSAAALTLSTAGDRLTTGGTLVNSGTLAAATGTVIDVVNFAQAGNALTNSGTLSLGGEIQGNGALANQPGAALDLQGGTVATSAVDNAGTLNGYGSVVPTVENSGTLLASGGTLSLAGGFRGGGTMQTDATGTLSLGANSTAGTLVNDGALALNGHTITVTGSYQNAAAGVGNAYDNHAGISGTGEILAAGATPQSAQTLAVNGGAPSAGNAVIDFGNLRVGTSAAASYAIGNANSAGPALLGAIQTAVNGGNITDGRLSGSGVTAQNWGPVSAGGASAPYTVTFTASSAGALTGQAVHVVNNFDNTNTQTLSIQGAAYQAASGQLNNTSAHPDTYDFGTIQVGQTVTSSALSISNVASGPSGYVEDLNASFGAAGANGGSGAASISGNGSISALAAGATNDSAMSISVTGTRAGTIQSGIGVNFYTAGTVGGHSDGLGTALVGTANVPVDGAIAANVNVVNAADPVVNNAPIQLGNVRQNSTSPTGYVSVTNQASAAPQAALDASISGGSGVTATGSFTGLDPGQTSDTALQVGIDTATAGHVSGLATLGLISDASNIGGCGTHCTMSLPQQYVAVSGNVYRLANPVVTTGTVTLAARVGDRAPSAPISVTNVSPDAYTEGLAASLGTAPQGWTEGGAISNLAAGATDAHSLQVGLSTAAAGVFNGTQTVNFLSNGLIDQAQAVGVGSASVHLQGDVYTAAVEQLGSGAVNFGVVHVGQTVADQAVAVSNTAAQTALNDTLTGSFAMAPGSSAALSAGGTLGSGVVAGQTNDGSLTVGMQTDVAGVYSGTAQFTGASHDAQLTDLQLATIGIAVSGQVNNYANATFQLTAGSGLLSHNGASYTLNLGALTQGSTVSSLLSVLNQVSGPADNFGGTFAWQSLTDLSLNGANWTAQSCNSASYAFCLGAQGALAGLGLSVDTGTLGAFNDTISLNGMGFYQGASYSPYQQNLTLSVEGDIVTGGGTSLPEPGTLALFAAGTGLLLALTRRRRAALRSGE